MEIMTVTLVVIFVCLFVFLMTQLDIGFPGPIDPGAAGENRVAALLSRLPADEYIVMNDVLLDKGNGTTQIDHIIVSLYGIFVIETKNYKGQIYGGEYSDHWTQNVFGETHEFYNPLKQNYGHVRALMRILRLPERSFIPIVAFSERAELKVDTTQNVVYIDTLESLITSCQRKLFDQKQISGLVETINRNRLEGSEQEMAKHVSDIKQRVSIYDEYVEAGRCPRCGGRLVMRNGRYGQFMGCSSYPRCRFTKNIH